MIARPKCKDFGNLTQAKLLLIGHDPTLQRSDTVAEYCLFANYYFNSSENSITKQHEKSKYSLAKNAFDCIIDLTRGRIQPEEVYLTNLCNYALPRAPKGKTVFIPKKEAIEGVNRIVEIISGSKIDYIFSMSLQVNYWLQRLDLYKSDTDFLKNAEPKTIGTSNPQPYYQPFKSSSFHLICGNPYKTSINKGIVIPILHVKNYPLKGKFKIYQDSYNKIKSFFSKEQHGT